MAEITFGGVGSASVASGVVTEATTFTFDAPATAAMRSLEVAQLPHLFFYVSTAVVGVTVTPQFAVRENFGAKTLKWMNLSPPVAIAAGVPSLLEFRFPARAIRLVITSAGIGDVDYAIAACSGV